MCFKIGAIYVLTSMLLVVVSLMMTAFHLIHRMPIVVRLAEGSRLVTNPFNLVAKSQQGAQRACHCRLISDGSHHLLSHICNPLPKCQRKCNRSRREGRDAVTSSFDASRPPSDRDGSYSVFGHLEQYKFLVLDVYQQVLGLYESSMQPYLYLFRVRCFLDDGGNVVL